jgi:glycosyltransferase involved in cell wall biosynthesis
MMQMFIPAWVKRHSVTYESVDQIPESTFERLRSNFKKLNSDHPVVSIIVIAYNEEQNILKSLSSLSEIKSKYPLEVIVSNNNSTDRTQEILDRSGVKSVFQPLQGVGFARDAGLRIAKGKYHLCADADSIYPPTWVDEMISPLEKGEAICTYGRVSFLPDGRKSRLSLAIYEVFKDVAIWIRSIKRPERVAGGASLAFFTRMGRQIGWRTDVRRGEEGHMVLAMKRFGHIKMVKTTHSRIWTTARTLDNAGSFAQMISKRLKRELSRLYFYFTTSKQNA